MSHCVPCFEMDDEFTIPNSSSAIGRNHKAEDDVMELLWQDGQVILHSQTQRCLHKSPPTRTPEDLPPPQPPPKTAAETSNHLHIAEDEMAAWLHYPFEDLTDLLYSNSTPLPQTAQTQPSAARLPGADIPPPQPPPPSRLPAITQSLPPSRPPVPPQSVPKNFQLFSRLRGTSSSRTDLTVVDSNDTPCPAPGKAAPASNSPCPAVRREDWSAGGGGEILSRSGGSGDLTVTSLPSSSGSGGATVETALEGGEPVRRREVEGRKRKMPETEEAAATTTECQTEDVELEYADEKKHSRSAATKRSRAAEVHNLSERRRRDRINEKMRALQELIPRCNKSDKASMLDEAIEYLKSLQMQVQMMSMGCGMVPMMYPGMQQQYTSPMGMGVGLGMGMEMGMSRPVLPFPSAVPGSALPMTPACSVVPPRPTATAASASQLAPRVPVPTFPMPPVPAPGVSVMQPDNQADSVHGSFPLHNSGLPQLPNYGDPHQQYIALQQMQMHMQIQMQMHMQIQMQNQSLAQPGSRKPSTSKSEEVSNQRG